jgi:RNA polymerase sigma-70 factor, ECF subfamily
MFQVTVQTINKTRRGIINDYREPELIKRCQQGEIAAFRDIYDLHSTMLYSIAMRMLQIKEDAEDALQNCFTNMYRGIGQFRGQSKFSSYLVRILMNCCYDILAKRRKDYETEQEHAALDSQSEWSLSLEKAITLLPLKMRECFILFAVEGFKQNEIADMLEISEGAVKAHIFQAKKKLREILK